jgi:hypothetical protein
MIKEIWAAVMSSKPSRSSSALVWSIALLLIALTWSGTMEPTVILAAAVVEAGFLVSEGIVEAGDKKDARS